MPDYVTLEEHRKLQAQVADLMTIVAALQADAYQRVDEIILGSDDGDPTAPLQWLCEPRYEEGPSALYGYTWGDEEQVCWIAPVQDGIGAALYFMDSAGALLFRSVDDAISEAERHYLAQVSA